MKNASGDEVFVPPLGLDNAARLRQRDVIAEAGQSGTGNTILRVGQELESGGWTQTAYLVLSPAERERLIEALMEHRKQAPGDGLVSQRFDGREIEALVVTAGEAVHGNGELSDFQEEVAQLAYDGHQELIS